MRLVLAEPRFLKDSIAVIAEIVNDVSIKIDKNKLELVAMDPASVAMVNFNLLSSAFVEYEVDKEYKISINLESFKQIIRRAKPSDTITIELDEKNNKLRVQLKGDSVRTFNISLLESDLREQKIPDLKFSSQIEVNTNIFDEAIEDMGVVAESVALTALKDKFIVEAEGRMNHAKVEISKDDETNIVLNGGSTTARYSLDYLKKIIKASKLADVVKINFDNEYPLRMEYKVLDKLNLVTILAPRVQND